MNDTRKKRKPVSLVSNQNHGDHPYIEKLGTRKFKKVPWCIYFYYIKPQTRGAPIVRRYSYSKAGSEIQPTELAEVITRLTLNAKRPDDQQNPWPEGYDWKGIVWRRRSYFVVVVDDPARKFVPGSGMTFSALGSENITFYDAKDFKLTVAGRDLPVFYCINHMKKNRDGDDLGSSFYYRFYLHTDPRLPDVVYPESGGQNQGPGIPP